MATARAENRLWSGECARQTSGEMETARERERERERMHQNAGGVELLRPGDATVRSYVALLTSVRQVCCWGLLPHVACLQRKIPTVGGPADDPDAASRSLLLVMVLGWVSRGGGRGSKAHPGECDIPSPRKGAAQTLAQGGWPSAPGSPREPTPQASKQASKDASDHGPAL